MQILKTLFIFLINPHMLLVLVYAILCTLIICVVEYTSRLLEWASDYLHSLAISIGKLIPSPRIWKTVPFIGRSLLPHLTKTNKED